MAVKQPYQLTNQGAPDDTDVVVSQPNAGGEVVKVPISALRSRSTHLGTQPMSTISDAGDSATLDVGTDAGTVAAGDHLHDDRYYTETELDTALTGKADTTHLHDDRYYTETELSNGQLDTRYYTETEVDTSLAGKEDGLGNPASDGYVLSSLADGTRSWIAGTIKQIVPFDLGTDYSISSSNEASMSDAVTVTPVSSTSSLIIFARAYATVYDEGSGNDARLDLALSHYDGADYVTDSSGRIGIANTTGAGGGILLYTYSMPSWSALLSQSDLRSDNSTWFFRLRGSTVEGTAATGEVLDFQGFAIEVEL